MFFYRAYGLLIESEIALPELLTAPVGVADVSICGCNRVDREMERWPKEKWFEGEPGRLRIRVEGVGQFLVKEGNKIHFVKEPLATEQEVRLFLLGSCLGALLLQRACLVLHGSVVVVDGKAVAFLGASGMGKSTLAAALGKKGHPLLSDDLCVIDGDGAGLVLPGYPQNKLWLDSLAELGVEAEGLSKVRPMLDKRAVPVESAVFEAEPCRLDRVYLLSHSDSDEISLERLEGSSKLAGLLACRYRPDFSEALGIAGPEFLRLAKVAERGSVSIAARPQNGPFKLEELREAILSDLLDS